VGWLTDREGWETAAGFVIHIDRGHYRKIQQRPDRQGDLERIRKGRLGATRYGTPRLFNFSRGEVEVA